MNLDKNYITKHIERFDKYFKISSRNEESLKKILKFGLEDISPRFNMKDYFKLLYTEPDSFSQVHKKILDNISNGDKFQIIHSYAKNGKSTFLKSIIYDNASIERRNLKLKFQLFDFSLNTNRSTAEISTFKNSTQYFLVDKYLFGNRKYLDERLNLILSVNNFFNNNYVEESLEYSDTNIGYFNDLFSDYREIFASHVSQYLHNQEGKTKDKNLKTDSRIQQAEYGFRWRV